MDIIPLAFITGLTAGGISCLAVQGGLLASSLSTTSQSQKRVGTLFFVLSKIVAYTILGALLGYFGSAVSISSKTQGILQIVAGLYMIATAANLLQVHPIFRYVVIQPPKWAYKLLKKESHRAVFGPMLLGALTVLVPCGISQGMMILAISSGSAITGALILAAFTIGTSPLFFVLGFAATEIMKRKSFIYAASALVFVLGVNSINAGNGLRGSAHTIGNYWAIITKGQIQNTETTLAAIDEQGQQNATITVNANGYTTTTNTLKVNVPVKLTLASKNAVGCVQVFTIPDYNVKRLIPQNGVDEIVFTPTKTGRLSFSCAMGMYTGSFQVI